MSLTSVEVVKWWNESRACLSIYGLPVCGNQGNRQILGIAEELIGCHQCQARSQAENSGLQMGYKPLEPEGQPFFLDVFCLLRESHSLAPCRRE